MKNDIFFKFDTLSTQEKHWLNMRALFFCTITVVFVESCVLCNKSARLAWAPLQFERPTCQKPKGFPTVATPLPLCKDFAPRLYLTKSVSEHCKLCQIGGTT